ncbi:MAG: hypothetical protein AVO35_02365 [Candidatus Aegiribacteria sp. MLS_C]|nr:MAG: hypothetical protein AVO35_02365 [Candidatus Aegiribacteria sp. MLS_C]
MIGIAVTTTAAFLPGTVPVPSSILSMPSSIFGILMKFDLAGDLSWGFISVLLTVFVMDFVDTMGTLLGLSCRACLLTWPLFKTVTGKYRQVPAGLWVLAALSLLYYAFGA